MAMPFFNNMLALLGAIGFWPSVVYFPVEMTIARLNIKKRSLKWLGLESLNFICFLLTLASASAAVRQITQALGQYKPFMYKA
ncbi:amino acid permease 8-like [Senna tora]|uniref:Amino acid permease 8-like n=1 Tax=Senna tora TaxID=362788 RepID=A0A834TZ51_9FABA|nr:amino acid permease 8-like [Senna tora]